MKSLILLLIFSLTIIHVQLILPPQMRQELLKKLTWKISQSDLTQDNPEFNSEFSEKMKYNVSDIQKLMAEYGLPENFSFFNKTGADIIIKDQGKCTYSEWAFVATSTLAYRYKTHGININLSPQEGISCYRPDCKSGMSLRDIHLNLVKNGTLTEQCFPFVSSDGKTIPECPTTCQDGSEFKKYYAQNTYVAKNTNQKNFYDLVILVMDQLITEGPISAYFFIYEDFFNFADDKEKCLNDVYSYDGTSYKLSTHMVTITGYGLLNNKFYWSIQNSWGEDWCDHGFMKMEIGQFLWISFSEPYIPPEQVTPVDIEVFLESIDPFDCYLKVNTTSSLDKWKNSLYVKFTHENGGQDIEFQIGKNKIRGKEELNCFYEIDKIFDLGIKGKYIFNEFKSLGAENNFILDSFKGKYFNYYASDQIFRYGAENYYISQVGRKIILTHSYNMKDDSLAPIYINKDHLMTNCNVINTSTTLYNHLIYCEITQDDFDYIEKHPNSHIYNKAYCDYFSHTLIILNILDTKLYPVFKVFKFFKPYAEKLTKETDLIIVANVTNSSQFSPNETGIFDVIIEIENQNQNKSVFASCNAIINSQNEETNLICHSKDEYVTYKFENLYLLPYSGIKSLKSPFEVIIETTIKAEYGPKPEPTDPTPTKSSYLEYSLSLLLSLKLLLF